MIYSARLPSSGSFNVGLNPLVAAAELLSEVVRLKHSDTAEDLNNAQGAPERLRARLRGAHPYEGVEAARSPWPATCCAPWSTKPW
jgi:type VI secretion system protein ImpK